MPCLLVKKCNLISAWTNNIYGIIKSKQSSTLSFIFKHNYSFYKYIFNVIHTDELAKEKKNSRTKYTRFKTFW